jgi:hypothetical protein
LTAPIGGARLEVPTLDVGHEAAGSKVPLVREPLEYTTCSPQQLRMAKEIAVEGAGGGADVHVEGDADAGVAC